MAVILRDCTHKSLIMVDELGTVTLFLLLLLPPLLTIPSPPLLFSFSTFFFSYYFFSFIFFFFLPPPYFSSSSTFISLLTRYSYSSSSSFTFFSPAGKGTSTVDGCAVAGSLLEYLDSLKVCGVFATHLHELLDMDLNLRNTRTVKMDFVVDESGA